MAEKSTHKRVRTVVVDGLADALKAANNGMPMDRFIDAILSEVLEQLRAKNPPGPLKIVTTLRAQSGLGSADALRSVVSDREELRSLVIGDVVKFLRAEGYLQAPHHGSESDLDRRVDETLNPSSAKQPFQRTPGRESAAAPKAKSTRREGAAG